ncbi:MAG: hypothetical protein QOJ99_519 [Bryobacterales bacterium]|nr:hypothetical protein [Bryobacterales bacterium]
MAAKRRRIVASQAFGVVEVSWAEFLRAIALEPEPLVIKSEKKTFFGSNPTGRFRYLASVKGLVFFVDYIDSEDQTLPESAIVIEAETIKVPKDI